MEQWYVAILEIKRKGKSNMEISKAGIKAHALITAQERNIQSDIQDWNNSILIVDNIYEAINKIDSDYAKMLSGKEFGLVYPTINNQFEIYIKYDNDLVNMILTTHHELTHIDDFTIIGEKFGIKNKRELTENDYIRLWSEFHATYISMTEILKYNEKYDYPAIKKETTDKLINYYNSCTGKMVKQQDVFDTTVRNYGNFFAICDYGKTKDNPPPEYIRGFNYFAVYAFLNQHKDIYKFIDDYNTWKVLLNRTLRIKSK